MVMSPSDLGNRTNYGAGVAIHWPYIFYFTQKENFIMERELEPIVMNNKFSKIFIHPLIGKFNNDTKRGWFAVSLKDYENQPLENKVFSEEWDVVDATYPGEAYYYTWLKVTYFGDKVPVKVTYSNGTHRWKPMGEILALIKDRTFGNNYSFRITEMRVRPYKYTDDYGHNRIAGQLQFVGVESDETYYPKYVSEKVDIPEEVEQAVTENSTVSSFDLEHDKPIVANDEITPAYDYRKDKLFKLLDLIDMEPKEALKILVDSCY
jgi:hypothetical protein